MTEISPGIYPGVPFKEYASWPALNRSLLTELKRSPAHLKHAQQNPRAETRAMRVGSATHVLVLEPDQFNDRYMCDVEGDGRKTVVKEAKAALRADFPDHCILDPDDYRAVFSVAEAVRTHPKAIEYINAARVELSLVWEDTATKVLCKARLDGYVDETGLVFDLKTTDDAGPESFAKSIWNFGYGNQAAYYRSGLSALGLPAKHHLFIAAEMEPPFGVAVYRLADEIIDLAQRENEELLRRYKTCLSSGSFPAYPEKVIDIGIPTYGVIKLEEKYGPVAY